MHVLSKIIADVHDANGRVTIPGFYDGVIEPPDYMKDAWSKLDLTAENFLKPIGLSLPVGEHDRLLVELISSRPTFEVNSLFERFRRRTIIRIATANSPCRLVANQDPIQVRDAVRAFIRAKVPADCRVEFRGGEGSPAVAVA